MRIVAWFVVLCLTANALGQMGPAAVVVAPVEQRALELTRPLVASVEPVTRATLAAEEGGLVLERTFDEGQRVERGALLVRLDTDLLEARKAAAEAAVRSAEAAVKQAEAELTNARLELERLQGLRQTQIATEKEVRDAQMVVDVNAARVVAREAEVALRQAEVSVLALQIAKSQVRSPFEGVVSQRHVEVGQWVRQGEAVADVVQLDPLFVRVNVPESVIPQLQSRGEATVTIDALGGETFTARVDQILPQADPNTRTFAVKLLLDNPEMRVRPGFFARVTLLSRLIPDAVVVPKNAVVTQGKESRVVLAVEDQAQIVPVVLVGSDGERYAIKPLQGEIKPGDQVVIRGNEALRPGAPLQILNAGHGQGGGHPGGGHPGGGQPGAGQEQGAGPHNAGERAPGGDAAGADAPPNADAAQTVE